jgi:hypothetical protein
VKTVKDIIPGHIKNPFLTLTTMDSLTSHPSTAAQAKTFVAPGSLSYPNAGGELTPPSSEKNDNTNGVATPAATPDAQNSTSGIGKLIACDLFLLHKC